MPSRSISDCHPDLQIIAKEFIRRCDEEIKDAEFRIICTHRSGEEQTADYAKGRTVNSGINVSDKRPLGATVTNAKAGQSKHNNTENGKPASRAFDIGVFINGVYDKDGKSTAWGKAGKIGMELNLNWFGAKGSKFFELAHFQLKG